MPLIRRIAAVVLVVVLPALARAQSLTAPPPADELDVTTYEVVYRLPGMNAVEVRADLPFTGADGAELHLDLALPAGRPTGSRVPVVVFVNGVGFPALKNWPIYRSWARLIAAAGMAAVTFEARQGHVDGDIAALFGALHERASAWGLDAERIGIWSCSGNVPPALRYAMGKAPGVRALVAYYGGFEPERVRNDLPVLHVRAGRDDASLNERQARMIARAIADNAPWTVINAPRMTHAFDGLLDEPESRAIVARTVEFLRAHLFADPAPPPAPLSPARQALVHVFAAERDLALPFYAELLKQRPDDPALLVRVAHLELPTRPADAARHFERAIELGEARPALLYNTACAWARAGEVERALDALERAIERGFSDARLAESDPDLEPLRGTPRFAALLARLAGVR